MIRLTPCTRSQSAELSAYLHPIWHEVYDDIELGGPEGVEYIFTNWVSADAIAESFAEGCIYGYIFDGEVRIGMYAYDIREDGVFYISKLYLEKEHRGKGYGRSVIAEMERIAEENGCSCLYLSAFFGNKPALRAYMKAGFEVHYRCLRYIGNGIVQNDCFMRKFLGGKLDNGGQ